MLILYCVQCTLYNAHILLNIGMSKPTNSADPSIKNPCGEIRGSETVWIHTILFLNSDNCYDEYNFMLWIILSAEQRMILTDTIMSIKCTN